MCDLTRTGALYRWLQCVCVDSGSRLLWRRRFESHVKLSGYCIAGFKEGFIGVIIA